MEDIVILAEADALCFMFLRASIEYQDIG